jgi:phosphoglycerol transferase
MRNELLTRVTASDREFSRRLETLLPPGAAVFQLPVVSFPEAPSVHQMIDYEQFRPYLWTDSLRFSYGTHKGREREEWQLRASGLEPGALNEYLGAHGFDAIVINRRGYEDRAQALESKLGAAEGPLVESSERDLVAYRVKKTASKRPKTYSTVALAEGFPWGWENNSEARWAWSNGRARLRFVRPTTSGRRYQIRLSVETLIERDLMVRIGDEMLASVNLVPGRGVTVAVDWVARGGERYLDLDTDRAAERPSNGDSRLLGFRIMNPVIEER